MTILGDLLARIRTGDQEAALQMVREYEPKIRRIVRAYLNDPRLRRQIGSDDVCQSVLFNLVRKLQDHETSPDLDDQKRLAAYLGRMIRNKVFSKARRYRAMRRDMTITTGSKALADVRASDPDPCDVVTRTEELANLRRIVSESDWFLLVGRQEGLTFPELGEKLGRKADAVRMQHARALETLAQYNRTTGAINE